MSGKNKKRRPFPIVALILAWLIPGAGHVYLGRRLRGAVIFLTIAATFWAGMAIGGAMTVDKKYEGWWFIADMCTGVHGLTGWLISSNVYDDLDEKLKKDDDYQVHLKEIDHRSSGQRRAIEYYHLRRQYCQKYLAEDGLVLVSPQEKAARAYVGVAGLLNLLCIFDATILALMGITGETAPSLARRKDDGAEQSTNQREAT